ncbi:hypothetical protein ACHAXR_007130 [Thalassiosira sp. AJA248-18]
MIARQRTQHTSPEHQTRRKRPSGSSMRAVVIATAASLSMLPTLAFAGEEKIYADHHRLPSFSEVGHINTTKKMKRRGRRKSMCALDKNKCTNFPSELWNAMNICRGGDMDMSSSTNQAIYFNDGTSRSEKESTYPSTSTAIVNAYDKTQSIDLSSKVTNASAKMKQTHQTNYMLDNTICDEPKPQIHHQIQSSPPRPKLVIEFDTQAVGGVDHGNSIRSRIRSRIGKDNEWNRHPHRGPALSISLDAFSPSSVVHPQHQNGYVSTVPEYTPESAGHSSNSGQALLDTIITPAQVAIILITQTAALLPPLLISRRALNSTWIAIVDYFRGRIFRTTFTNLERAYLRYYEFPAVTRATARLVSQIGILLGLNWAVRWWMIWVAGSEVVGPTILGVTGIDIGMIGTAGSAIGPGWKVGLPCHQRGKGMAWLCGFFWIGAVVGIGHACAMALSVWGGPLRVQAAAQHAENPKTVLRRIIHHPIKWIKGMEEWKYLSCFQQRNRTGKDRSGRGEGVFNPDPILFPATWLPLRWLQIFAVAKAVSTDPLQYRWCSPDDSNIVIPRLMKQYLVQLALGDEWQRVFLGEKRVGLGVMVVFSYFIALLFMVFTAFTLDGGAAAMLIPSILAAIISGFINMAIFWNRLGTKEQKQVLETVGWL